MCMYKCPFPVKFNIWRSVVCINFSFKVLIQKEGCDLYTSQSVLMHTKLKNVTCCFPVTGIKWNFGMCFLSNMKEFLNNVQG